jgi:Domain of unknown function (DUF222)/HNH endonuclease
MGYAANIVREVARSSYGPGPAPEPAKDPDIAEDLGDEIATLAAHIHAATHRFLVLIARFDRLLGWEPAGHRTCAHWLAFRTGLDLGTAREHVRVARALEELPGTNAAMAQGALAFSQVRALTRVAEPDTEEDLLALAEGCTTAQLERVVRAWKRGSRKDEAEQERERHNSRTLSVFPDEEGMYVVTGLLDPEVGVLLMRAIEAASDALYRKREREQESDPAYAYHADCEAARRRADAVGLVAERALAAGFGGRGGAVGVGEESPTSASESASASESDPPISGTRAERLQVVLHAEPATLAAEGEPGRSELEDGTRVSAETSRRLSCDAGLVRVTRGPDGSLLSVGRRTRTVPPSLRRALEVRDRGCRFPGCGLRFTDAHHVIHWADGGETNRHNTVLLCRYHHRLVHEEGWCVEWWGKDRTAAFRDPRGSVHVDGRWRPPRLRGDPVAALNRQNRLHGADPDAYTASARWKRERDIPDNVLFRASEAAV